MAAWMFMDPEPLDLNESSDDSSSFQELNFGSDFDENESKHYNHARKPSKPAYAQSHSQSQTGQSQKERRRSYATPVGEEVLLEVWKKMLQEWSPSNSRSTEPARILIYTCPIPGMHYNTITARTYLTV